MHVRVGTSGYQYKEWKGSFYPADLSTKEMLGYYGERFPTVEINNTFYRMPKESVVLNWATQVPAEFRFVLKASRRITHMHRLKNAGDPLSFYLQACTALGDKRGPSLFQLPPNMKKDLERLRGFLDLLPRRWQAAFEFRHDSWYDEDVYNALRESNAALCLADTDDAEPPLATTADWGYLRLRRAQYTETDLESWAKRVADFGWSEMFVFFKHERHPSAPLPDGLTAQQLALLFRSLET